MGIIYSVVCVKKPIGRREVYFFAAYRPCLHSNLTSHDVRLSMRGRTEEEARRQAEEFAGQCNRCRYDQDGLRYVVEEIDELSPDRAPA